MGTNEQLRNAWRQYQSEHGHLPVGSREVVEWAVDNGLLDIPPIDPLDVAADMMSRTLREETAIDGKGRSYRVNQAVRVSRYGVQMTIWGVGGLVEPSHSEMSFQQRREGIISDCCKLKTDVDVHNDQHPDRPAYQLELDFTEDVAEREAA